MRKPNSLVATVIVVLLDLTLPPLAPDASAGKGGSPEAIRSAIQSGSIDAISAELERAERLVCGGCIAMIKPLVDHQDARVRRVATWWLARHGMQSDLYVQSALRLAQPDSTLARNAADVLGSLRTEKAVAPLGAGLNNPIFNAEARATMALALGRIGEASAIPALKQAMKANEAPVRAAALEGLRALRGPLDPTPAATLLTDADATVRIEAIYTVGAARTRVMELPQGTEIARGLVLLLKSDANSDVRKKAAWALGEIGAPASVAGAQLSSSARYDAEPAVRSLAQAALSRLPR
jgi:HEAT repeat protein